MVLFERNEDEKVLPKYENGTEVIGFNRSMSDEKPVCGKIVEIALSTSYLNQNKYKVKGEYGGWLNENEILLFDTEIWKNVKRVWEEYLELKEKTHEKYLEFFNSWVKGE